MQVTERRFAGATLRALVTHISSSPGRLTGYSSVFNRLSEDLGGFFERVSNTAFDSSLRRGDDVRALFNHDPNFPLGRVSNGSLRLSSDSVGLHMQCDLPNTSYARDLLASVERGDIADQSFAFQCEDEGWSDEPDPQDRSHIIKVRTLRSVRLIDCSPVVFPAYPQGTSVSVASDVPSRSRSFDSMFPCGLPSEVRSRIGADALKLLVDTQERRRRLTNLILGL